MKKKQLKWLFISLVFSIAVISLVLYFTIDETTLDYLARLNPVFLVLALFLHFMSLLFWSLRIQLMAKSLGYSVGLHHCVNLVFANTLVAAVTPSQAGGEPVRIHELYRANVKVGDATAIVIVERVIDGVVLGLTGVIAMFFLGSRWNSMELDIGGIMLTCVIVVSICILAFIYSVKNPEFLKSILMKTSGWIAKHWHSKRLDRFVGHIDHEVDNFHNSLTHFVGKAKKGLLWGFFFTTLYWISEFSIASFILMGLGIDPFFFESFLVQLIIAIVMMLPLTPGGSGIAELSASSFYGLFVPSSIVGVFVVLWRFILYYVNIIIGLLSSIIIVRREMILRRIGLK